MGEIRSSNKIVVGYDLGNLTSQISYCYLSMEEPETITTIAGAEQYNIPTILCKRTLVNQWFYGKEAEKNSKEENGIIIRNLLQRAHAGETITIETKEYPAEELLTLFVKRSLGLLSMACPVNKIEALVITVDELDARMVAVLKKVAQELPIRAKEIFFQSKEESFFSYIIHQKQELWQHQVMLCDMTEGYLKTFRMEMNRKTRPVVAFIEKVEFLELNSDSMPITEVARANFKENFDKQIANTLQEVFAEHLISAVYLIGDLFNGEWCTETIRFLCQGRRVFQGNNLYSKGACYLAKEKLEQTELAKTHVFLGNDKIKANIGMKLFREGQEVYLALLDAGQNWYESHKEVDVLLESDNRIEVMVTPVNGRNAKTVEIILEGLPIRPAKASRIKLMIDMSNENTLRIRAEDMGFGEIFPATGKEWIEELEI